MKRNAVAWAAMGVALVALVGSRSASRPLPAAQDVPEEGQKIARALSDAFGAVAEFVAPSVVQINVEKKVSTRPGGNGRMPRGLPEGRTPQELEEMLKRFFGGELPKGSPFQKEQFVDNGTGSGFVLDDKGHIMTNAHVVDGADKIVVSFADGSQTRAKVVGISTETDVAVIQVEGSNAETRPVKVGDSDELRVGQWVLALGSPFGLDHTVTAGIISATQRQDLNINRFEAFIQTDAAINPGNSGGPLVDLSGRVVGINSAIATASRSNSGVGFAIPINMAVRIAEKLIKDGKVAPALVGVRVDPVTPALARQLGLDPKTKGLVITDVNKNSPAEKSGLTIGDVILSYDGQEVTTLSGLQYLVTTSDIGKSYKVVYLRDGQKREASVAPVAPESLVQGRPRREENAAEKDAEPADRAEFAAFGMAVAPLDDPAVEKFKWDRGQSGVVVVGIIPESPAQQAGMEIGDLITRVVKDKKITPIRTVAELQGAAKDADELAVFVEDVRRKLPGQFMTLKRQELEDGKAPSFETKPSFVPGREGEDENSGKLEK